MKGNYKTIAIKESGNCNGINNSRTTIGLRTVTKNKLDKNRAPGQCYDGFIWQLIDMWEKADDNGR